MGMTTEEVVRRAFLNADVDQSGTLVARFFANVNAGDPSNKSGGLHGLKCGLNVERSFWGLDDLDFDLLRIT